MSIPLRAVEVLRKVGEVYVDIYTSPWKPDLLDWVKGIAKGRVKEVKREFLENVEKVAELGNKNNIAIVCMGDPYIATTHNVLRIKAKQKGVKVETIYSSSFINVLFGELGLHFYKLGYLGTIIDVPPSNLISVYLGVKRALELGRHSVLLLEYDFERKFHLDPGEALLKMKEIEKSFKGGLFEDDLALIVASRVGYEDQKFVTGFLSELIGRDYGEPPHSIVIPAKLHFTEKESLNIIHNVKEQYLNAFGKKGESLLSVRTKTTIDKTEKALNWVKENFSEDLKMKFFDVLENVECYLDDAKRFLKEGKSDLALIEACYAEGLLDSLRLQGYKIKW